MIGYVEDGGGEISKDQSVVPSINAEIEATPLDLYLEMRPRVCAILALCAIFAFCSRTGFLSTLRTLHFLFPCSRGGLSSCGRSSSVKDHISTPEDFR